MFLNNMQVLSQFHIIDSIISPLLKGTIPHAPWTVCFLTSACFGPHWAHHPSESPKPKQHGLPWDAHLCKKQGLGAGADSGLVIRFRKVKLSDSEVLGVQWLYMWKDTFDAAVIQKDVVLMTSRCSKPRCAGVSNPHDVRRGMLWVSMLTKSWVDCFQDVWQGKHPRFTVVPANTDTKIKDDKGRCNQLNRTKVWHQPRLGNFSFYIFHPEPNHMFHTFQLQSMNQADQQINLLEICLTQNWTNPNGLAASTRLQSRRLGLLSQQKAQKPVVLSWSKDKAQKNQKIWICIDMEKSGCTYIHTDRRTDRQTDIHTHTHIPTYLPTYLRTYIYIYT